MEYIGGYLFILFFNFSISRFLEPRFKFKKVVMLFNIIIQSIILAGVNYAIKNHRIYFFSHHQMDFSILSIRSYISLPSLVLLACILGTIISYKGDIRKRIASAILVINGAFVANIISFLITFRCFKMLYFKLSYSPSLLIISIDIIFAIILVVSMLLIQKYLFKVAKYDFRIVVQNKKLLFYFIIINIFGLILGICPSNIKFYGIVISVVQEDLYIILAIVSLFITGLSAFLFVLTYEKTIYKDKNIDLDVKVKALEEYIKTDKIASEQKNRVLHDVKNHMNTLKGIIASESDVDKEILEYIKGLEEDYSKIYADKITSNTVVNSILVQKKSECLKNNISFNINCGIPSKVGVKDYDLSAILCNLLDNAIEENLRCEEGQDKYINFDIKISDEVLLIKIENLSRHKGKLKKDNLKTKKTGIHGYGIKNVKNTIEKYNGTVKFINDNYKFEASAYLFCKSEENN